MTASPPDEGASLLSSPVRREIIDLVANRDLEGAGVGAGMSAAEIAAQVGRHVTTVRFHLDQLVGAGLMEAGFARQPGAGRPRKVYRIAPGSFRDVPAEASYAMLTELLAKSFAASAAGEILTPQEAGHQWALDHVEGDPDEAPARSPGQWLGKVGRMVDVLRDWGYTPNVATRDDGRTVEVELVDCPFLEIASTQAAIVCGIHRGLIAGALERLGEGGAQISLEPFVEPNRCLAHLTTTTSFRRHPTSEDQSP